MIRFYETMYILRPDLPEQIVDEAIARYQTFLQDQSAESITIQHRGKRRLAYEINRHREGVYVQMNYNAAPKTIEILEKAMRLDESVIRYMTVKPKSETPIMEPTVVQIEPEAIAMQRGTGLQAED